MTIKADSRFADLLAPLLRRRASAGVAGIYLAERVASLGTNFILLAVMARRYGPVAFGTYAYAWSMTQLVMNVVTSGMEAILVRELIHGRDRRPQILGGASLLVLGASILGAMILGGGYLSASPPTRVDSVEVIGLVLMSALLPACLLVIESVFKSAQEARTVLTARLIASLGAAIVKGVLLALLAPLVWVAAAFALEYWLLAALYVGFAARAGFAPWTWRLDRALAALLARLMLPAAASALSVTLFFRVNVLLIPRFWGYAALGSYSLAMNFVQVFDTLLGVIVSTTYPSIVAAEANHPGEVKVKVRRLARLFAALAYGATVGAMVAGPFAINLLFGPRYEAAGGILMILAAASIASSSGLARAQFINARRLQRIHVWNTAVGLAVLVPASWILTSRFGAIGAAWAHLAGMVAAGIVASFLFAETRPVGALQLRALVLR